MRHSRFVAAALFFLAPAAAHSVAPDERDAATEEGKVEVTLEDRLSTGLKARRPEDVAFVEHVAEMVRAGRLPAKVVDSTYLWAIRRRQAHPFPAFQKAIRLQADRLGIDVD
jgi:hypothetical protein